MAAAPPTIDELPDHVLTEVMLRVPTPAALVHAAAVSKCWRRVATSTSKFLEDYRARHKSSPFLGLYIPRRYGGLPSFQMADSIQSAAAGDDRDLDLQHAAAKVSSFSLSGLEIHPEWRLLDCYNGRLLLDRGGESLEVYNPLSQERISVDLPQDFIFPDGFATCLLQGHGDHGSSFRVVSVQSHRRDRMVHAVEYDSYRKSWNHLRDRKILKNIEGTQREVMHAGSLVFCKYTGASLLLLDTREMQFSVLPLPADNNWKHYAIGQMEDGVCCLVSVEPVGKLNTLHLRVWRLEKLNWKLEKAMEVALVLGKHAPDGALYYRARKVTDGMAVLCSGRDLHFVVDLKTFRVMGKFEFSKELPAFPMQMHWPPAFSVATISGEQSRPAACGGEVESAKTDGKCEQEAGKNEDAEEEPDTKGDPDYRIKDSESPHAHKWGLIQVCIKEQRCLEDFDDNEGGSLGSCEEGTAQTSGENEDAVDDFDTKGDAGEESPPSRGRRRKRVVIADSTPKDDEAEETPMPSRSRCRQKSGECGDSLLPPPDHLRCRRMDGKKWRCSGRALPTVSFCEYHYVKANKGKKLPADGEVLAVALQRQKNKSINPPVATISVMNPGNGEGAETWQQSGERGDSLPDHLRCRRSDGKKWRCSGRALPTVSFCEYHYIKANKGKKLPVPADGEVLAVALQKLKNKGKGWKCTNPPALPQATPSDRQARDLWNGLMAISPGITGPAAPSSPVTTKVGVEISALIRRCYNSRKAEPLPVVSRAVSMEEAVPRTYHRRGLARAARIANGKNCKKTSATTALINVD